MHRDLLIPFELAIDKDILRITFDDQPKNKLTRLTVEFKDYLTYTPSKDNKFNRRLICSRDIPYDIEWIKYDLYIRDLINEIILCLTYKLQWFYQDIHWIENEYILTKK